MQLRFGGIDPSARVYVDGELAGTVSGPFGESVVDITDHLAPGAAGFDLAVVLSPVPPSEPQVGRTDRVRRHAPRLNYGWDFCPPFPHQGLWRTVYLETGPTLLKEPDLTATLTALTTGTLEFAAAYTGVTPAWTLRAVLPDGRTFAAPVTAGLGRVNARLTIPDPPLWYPWGYGAQALVTVTLLDRNTPLWQARTGFRTLEWRLNPERLQGFPSSTTENLALSEELPYTPVVNGLAVPGTGFNWTPADAQFGAITTDRIEHLLRLAVAAGGRVLRVWGGGLLETPEFYDLADRLGLLVWQEFSQSSSGEQSAPTDDPAYVAALAADAVQAVRERHHHPSLVLWDGGNELQGTAPLATADSPALMALADVIRTYDPGRAWLPTSPSGGCFTDDGTGIPGDVHGPWEHQGLAGHAARYNGMTALAHTEFGVEGMATPRQLDWLIDPADRWPPVRGNPVYRHLGEWWINTGVLDDAVGGALTPRHPGPELVEGQDLRLAPPPSTPVRATVTRHDGDPDAPRQDDNEEGPCQDDSTSRCHPGPKAQDLRLAPPPSTPVRATATRDDGDPDAPRQDDNEEGPRQDDSGDSRGDSETAVPDRRWATLGPGVPADPALALARVRRVSWLLQATGLAYIVEADRRRAPRCSLVLPWQLGESFPNAFCTALVDYTGDAKPALWAVARAFAPARVSLAVDADVTPVGRGATVRAWVWDVTGAHGPGRVVIRRLDLAGTAVAAVCADVRPWDGLPVLAGELTVPTPPPGLGFWAARWEDTDGRVVDESYRLTAAGTHWGEVLGDGAAVLPGALECTWVGPTPCHPDSSPEVRCHPREGGDPRQPMYGPDHNDSPPEVQRHPGEGRDPRQPTYGPGHRDATGDSGLRRNDDDGRSCGTTILRLTNRANRAVILPWVGDARAAGAPGWFAAPIPADYVFPGQSIDVRCTWSGTEPGPVLLDWVNNPGLPVTVHREIGVS